MQIERLKSLNLYRPIGVDIASRFDDSSSTLIWWYPEVMSRLAKNLASGSICLSSCPELSVGHTGLSIAWLSFLKSVTIRTLFPSPFRTGNAFEDHCEGSVPHGVICPAFRHALNSVSYRALRWCGVSYGFKQNEGLMFVSLILSFTGGTFILSSGPNFSLKQSSQLVIILFFSFIHSLLGVFNVLDSLYT